MRKIFKNEKRKEGSLKKEEKTNNKKEEVENLGKKLFFEFEYHFFKLLVF